MLQTLQIKRPFRLESGAELESLKIAYHLLGDPSGRDKSVVWVFHALTGNSNPLDWWGGIVGKGKVLDPDNAFIVCANVLGSCYGTTGPASVNPATGKPWLGDFPLVTVRDMVNAHLLLRDHLGIRQIDLAIGSSLGAFQGLEWAIAEPDTIKTLFFIAASTRCSPWAKAFNEAHRMAIQADPTFFSGHPNGGEKGLKAARAIGMVSYRSYEAFHKTQADPEDGQLDNYRACSYQQYQGEKLARRFNAHAYYLLTKAFDSHDAGRGRGGLKEALGRIKAKTHCVSIQTDLLFPVHELEEAARMIPGATHQTIESLYGHDGFLVENDKLESIIRAHFKG
jgi:homoserine O-acetyltransferase/O-succinyltransferase